MLASPRDSLLHTHCVQGEPLPVPDTCQGAGTAPTAAHVEPSGGKPAPRSFEPKVGTTPYASSELKQQGDAGKDLSRAAPHGRASEGWQAGVTIYSFSPQASGHSQGSWSLRQPRLLTRGLHKYVMFYVPRTRKTFGSTATRPSCSPFAWNCGSPTGTLRRICANTVFLQQVVSASTNPRPSDRTLDQ